MNSKKLYKPTVIVPVASLSEPQDNSNKNNNNKKVTTPFGINIFSNRSLNFNYLPAGGYHRNPNHFEQHSFRQMGLSILAGGTTAGNLSGFYHAIKPQYQSPKMGRSKIFNYVIKCSWGTANVVVPLAFLYSTCNLFLHYIREEDDEINKLTAGALTGMIYKSTTGIRNCAIGGGIGLGLAASYYLFHTNAIKEFINEKF